MALALYNTLTRQVEPFAPLAAPRVTLYTCGPTVWNYAHIGNFRTFLFEDLLRRHLEAAGFDVYHVMNLTDVDDRIIKEAAAARKTITAQTEPFAQAFFEDSTWLRILPAHVYPRATTSIAAMVQLVERLLANGAAYRADDGSVYFAIDRFRTYGRLSRLDTREVKVGARVASDEYAKDNPSDFALWKAANAVDEQVGSAWDAPFGRGRPGWHLECSAMILDEFGRRFGAETLDIHCGGVDLIFPHHENEIAQSEAATGKPFARYWLHGAFLNVKGTKMSKRFGNFLTVRDLKENGVDPGAFRHLVYSTHYRQELDVNDDSLNAAREGARRLGEFGARLGDALRKPSSSESAALTAAANAFVTEFTAALDDDLNAPRALARTHDFVRECNRALDAGQAPGPAVGAAWQLFERTLAAQATVRRSTEVRISDVINLREEARAELDFSDAPPPDADAALEWARRWAGERARAKAARDFKRADEIRDRLKRHGYEIRDRKDGTFEVVRGS